MVEAIHLGDIAVVDSSGKLLASIGNPREKRSYWRSSAKPFQAIPIVTSGAYEAFGLSEDELSQCCASHSGEAIHVSTVRSILKKVGLTEDKLHCGSHYPYNVASTRQMQRDGIAAEKVHCNCSGKHSGMLALCKQLGADIDSYTELEHPVQQAALNSIALFTGLNLSEIPIGIDGCGVPVHGLSIYHMALAWARLGEPKGIPEDKAKAAAIVRESMMAYPYLVAGEGRTCTDLMEALKGKLVAKSGANAVYCFAVPEKGIGVALKIADGGSAAVPPAVFSLLKQLKLFSDAELKSLAHLERTTLTNHRQDVVGGIEAVFNLKWH
jgi:L-asparaginase II